MHWLLVVIVVVAIAGGLYKCSPKQESRLEQTVEIPEHVEQDVLRHLEQGMERNRRALGEQEKSE